MITIWNSYVFIQDLTYVEPICIVILKYAVYLFPESLFWHPELKVLIYFWGVCVCGGSLFRSWEGDVGGSHHICWWACVYILVIPWGLGFHCHSVRQLWAQHPALDSPSGTCESHYHHRRITHLSENGPDGPVNPFWPCQTWRMLRILDLRFLLMHFVDYKLWFLSERKSRSLCW